MRIFDAVTGCRLAATAVLAAFPALAHAADATSLAEAITGGKANLDTRLRYEHVDQDNALDNADAFTLRTRLGYTTGSLSGISAMIEYEGVVDLSSDAYNSTLNGETTKSVVADPDGNELNQAYLQFAGLPGTTIKLGRQKIILDNARFVGNVGWRQNEQTFDGVSLVNKSLANTTLTYDFLTRANRIVFNDFDMDAHVINANYKTEVVNASAYAYLVDYDPGAPTPPPDSATYGARVAVTLPMPVKPSFTVEYAKQTDYADAPSTVDADYLLGSVSATFGPVTPTIAYEVLGGDGTYGFSTPLATLHAFQGWADVFLATPATGIQDIWGSLAFAFGGVKLLAVYHDFSADEGSADYGSEIDIQATKAFTKTFGATLKYANYSADDFAVDTEKFWAMVEYKF